MLEIAQRFASLKLGGCCVVSFGLQRTEKLVICLEKVDMKERLTWDSELQFNRVKVSMIDANATVSKGFGNIISFHAHVDSLILRKYLEDIENKYLVGHVPEEFIHFSVISEHAKFEVIAADFSFSIVDRGTIQELNPGQ